MDTLFSVVRRASNYANEYEDDLPTGKHRTLYSVLASVTSEVGELAQEVAIKSGQCSKDEGPDGVVGEALDVIVAALDIIAIANPDLKEIQLVEMAQRKCNKWLSKIN